MKKTVMCPVCGKEIKRQTTLFQNHYLQEHDERLSDGDAFKLMSPSSSSNHKLSAISSDKKTKATKWVPKPSRTSHRLRNVLHNPNDKTYFHIK